MTDKQNGYSQYSLTPSSLRGYVRVSGAKNSVLRLLAASLLCAEPVEIANYPSGILDAQIHVKMLEVLGKSCLVAGDSIRISEPREISSCLTWSGRSIRNTLLILGALVARTGSGAVPVPGGCQLGDRNYDLHVMLLRALGADVWEKEGMLFAHSRGRLRGVDIHLPIRSTGATENTILCASLAEGVTRLWNPHVRPEVLDLIAFLRKMGAIIEVFGQERIEIQGVEGLTGTKHRVIEDNMEALTWLIASVITKGDIEIVGFPFDALEVPLIHLRESGARFYRNNDSAIV
ncbi:MAG: UDP-N-acetylglucosamine 1-carboxyvinyltransferase, partial [Syntrophobacter sp.]